MYSNPLLLLSGQEVPFEPAQLVIHLPKIKDISLIGERTFYLGCSMLLFSKDDLEEEDKIALKEVPDFEVLMTLMMNQTYDIMTENKVSLFAVLALLFPDYRIEFDPHNIIFIEEDNETNKKYINASNFDAFKYLISEAFCFKDGVKKEYNPTGDLSSKIAEKLKKRHSQLAKLKDEKKNSSTLTRLVSILAVGLQKDINSLMNYTIYQLFDEYARYQLKYEYDMVIQMRLAGAKDVKDAEDWTKDLYNDTKPQSK